METRVLTAHVPVELAEQVDKRAKSLERSRGWVVKQALADWLYWEEEKDRRTREALADFDAGRLIDHEDVATWVKSLSTDDPLPLPRSRNAG